MYFYSTEVESTLPEECRTRRAAWIKARLKSIGAELAADRSAYKRYGSYWWGVKALLKRHAVGGKRAWFHGPSADEETRRRSDHGDDALNLQAALNYAELCAPDGQWLQRDEAALHICEWSDGGVELYRLADGDTGRQLDLFAQAERQAERLSQYLGSVADFLPRTWRSKGDRALQNGNLDLAVACYRRMMLLAGDGLDRTEAWLLLGMTFDQKRHFNKAIFCYLNLYEREKQHWLLGNIAASYSQAGKFGAAVDYYEQALRHMPGNPEFEAGLRQNRLRLSRQQEQPPAGRAPEPLLSLVRA